jgi:hypothetical protein
MPFSGPNGAARCQDRDWQTTKFLRSAPLKHAHQSATPTDEQIINSLGRGSVPNCCASWLWKASLGRQGSFG